MSYKEKLLKLHSVAMAKMLVLLDYESRYISEEVLCGGICDPIHYERRMELYERMQEALSKRDLLAQRVNEHRIDISASFPR